MPAHLTRVLALLGCLSLIAIPRPLDAQRQAGIGPGDRVRVGHSDPCCASPQVGELVSIGVDSVVLRHTRRGSSGLVVLPRGAVRSLDRGVGRSNYRVRGAVLGFLGGIAAGLVVLELRSEDCPDCWGEVLAAPFYAGGGALVGTLVGYAVGRSLVREKWRRVPLPPRIGVAPIHDRMLALRLAVAF